MAYDENVYARIISGELTDEEINKLKQTGEWEEITRILEETGEWTLPKFDKSIGYNQIKNRVNQSQPGKSGTVKFWPLILSIAASLLLLMGIFQLLSDKNQTFKAAYSQTEFANLPDGSTVQLNDGSKLTYKSNNWDEKRELNLLGEAYFNVSKGNKFKVITDRGSVEVLGTSFNVRTWGSEFIVECYEGSVEVSSQQTTNTLKAKESIRIDINGNTTGISKIDFNKPYWVASISRFYGETLNEVFKELERQYDIKIQHKEDLRMFAGSFTHKDLKEALMQVCTPMKLDFVINDKIVEIK